MGDKVPKPKAADLALLDPNLDVSKMAPSTLILQIRKQRREAKRQQRSETRRSNLRASTLKSEQELIEKEKQEKITLAGSRKGRRAQHETGEVRGARPMTQDELIAAALEEEERNKEALTDWLRKEEERRELRRVGRKRVRGPRWTWISRTVGKLVEVVDDKDSKNAEPGDPTPGVESSSAMDAPQAPVVPRPSKEAAAGEPSETSAPAFEKPPATADSTSPDPVVPSAALADGMTVEAAEPEAPAAPASAAESSAPTSTHVVIDPEDSTTADSAPSQPFAPAPVDRTSTADTTGGEPTASTPATTKPRTTEPATPIAEPTEPEQGPSGPYMRNYLILSQIPGGLPAELSIVLGDHVDWNNVRVIPARNRPINRKRPMDPLAGTPAKYRHPESMMPYTTVESFKTIESVLAGSYFWSEAGFWAGGEADASAEGVQDIAGWKEAQAGGWLAGKPVQPEPDVEVEVEEEVEVETKRGRQGKKRKAPAKKSSKSKRRR